VIFERLPFTQVYDTCATKKASERGNITECYGSSVENITVRCPISGVALPANNPGTDDYADTFVLMSALAATIGIPYPSVVDITSQSTDTLHATFRRLAFAARIHPRNFIEGMFHHHLLLQLGVPLCCRPGRKSRIPTIFLIAPQV